MFCLTLSVSFFTSEQNLISVWNGGHGIPVEMHATEKMYVPELIFGTLLTSSNYDDEQKKVTGGRNGYGAKLCNIFSTEFTVETACKESGKTFKQVQKKMQYGSLICTHACTCTHAFHNWTHYMYIYNVHVCVCFSFYIVIIVACTCTVHSVESCVYMYVHWFPCPLDVEEQHGNSRQSTHYFQ